MRKFYINSLGSSYSTLTLKTKPVNVIGVSDAHFVLFPEFKKKAINKEINFKRKDNVSIYKDT